MTFRVFGRVIVKESRGPVPDLMVSVFDADPHRHGGSPGDVAGLRFDRIGDTLGTGVTDEHGRFEVPFEAEDFRDPGERRPDLVVAVFAPLTSEDPGVAPRPPGDRLLHFSTHPWVRAGRHEGVVVRVREAQLTAHGIGAPARPPADERTRRERLATAFAVAQQRREELVEVAAETIAHGAGAALEARTRSAKAALTFSTVDPAIRDDPFVIPDTATLVERRERIEEALDGAAVTGLEDLGKAITGPVALRIDEHRLRDLLPPGATLDDIPLPVTLDVLCGLIHAAAGGHDLRRTRSLRDAAERLRTLRGEPVEPGEEDEDHDDEDEGPGGGDTDASVSERIKALVEAQVADLADGADTGEPLGPLALQRLRVELAAAEIAAGPADTTAYHDLHTIQIAYPDVWVEALDPRMRKRIRKLHEKANRLARETGLGDDAELGGEIDDLEEFLDYTAGLADAVTDARRGSMREEVGLLWADVKPHWHLLEPAEAAFLTEVATEPFRDLDAIDAYRSSLREREPWKEEIAKRVATGRELLDGITWELRSGASTTDDDADDSEVSPIARLRRLLEETAAALGEKYAFRYYAANSVNFGIVVTYRQRWEPGSYQVGEMVGTVPLAPGETRRLNVRETRRTSRARKELERALSAQSGESSRTARATTEVVRRAEASTNFTMTSEGSLNIAGIASIGGGTSFARNQSTHSQTVKGDFREAVIRASHELRNERSLELATSQEDETETTATGELSNPNTELTVTYLLYELERQFRVSEQLHRLQPVVLVAQRVPRPDQITEAWLLRHEWILRRVLLDDSLARALDDLHGSFAGEEVSIGVKRANWEAQVRMLENLEGEHSRWLALKRELNRDLIDATYRERVAEAAEDAGGLLGDIGRSLSGFDPLDMAEGELEARRKSIEEHLKWVHDELQQSAEKLAAGRGQLDAATRAYAEALEAGMQRRALIDQLRIHVKDNILHYMQAIWSHEPPDQRYFRLHEVRVTFPQAGTVTCRVRAAAPEEGGHPLPGAPFRNVVIENCEAPRWDPDAARRRSLHEVADLDKPLGFKGNYMIFPLRECNLVTDYMLREYVDGYFGIRDPDELSEFSTAELVDYREALDPDEREALDALLTRRLSSPASDGETVVLPTGHMYMEALVGTHTLLEPFKLAHRGIDAAKAREELRRAGLENLRYAARLVADEPLLDDPEIETRVDVTGDGAGVNVDVP